MMAVSAAPRTEVAWVCPECGHGSPEPRDRQAHLDAHRQLRQFIEAWDAAAAADQAAERRRRRLYSVVVALVVVVLAGISLRGVGERDAAPTLPTGPVPGVAVPRADPSSPFRSPAPGPSTATAPVPSAPSPVTAGQAAAPQPPAPTSLTGPYVPPAAGAATPPGTVDAVPPAAVEQPSSLLRVRGCFLVVCVDLGR